MASETELLPYLWSSYSPLQYYKPACVSIFVYSCFGGKAYVLLEQIKGAWGLLTENTQEYFEDPSFFLTKESMTTLLTHIIEKFPVQRKGIEYWNMWEPESKSIIHFMKANFGWVGVSKTDTFKWLEVSNLIAAAATKCNVVLSIASNASLTLDPLLMRALQNDTFVCLLNFLHLDITEKGRNNATSLARALLSHKLSIENPENIPDISEKINNATNEKEEQEQDENEGQPQTVNRKELNRRKRELFDIDQLSQGELQFLSNGKRVKMKCDEWHAELKKIKNILTSTKKLKANPKKARHRDFPYIAKDAASRMRRVIEDQQDYLGDSFPFMQFGEFTEKCSLDDSRTLLTSENELQAARAWNNLYGVEDNKYMHYFEFCVLESFDDSQAYVGWSSPLTDLLDLRSTNSFAYLKPPLIGRRRRMATRAQEAKRKEKKAKKVENEANKVEEETKTTRTDVDMEIEGDEKMKNAEELETKRNVDKKERENTKGDADEENDGDNKDLIEVATEATFWKGDLIGCKLDSDTITFMKNGKFCASFPKPAEERLLPHFMLKKCKIIAIFGATPFMFYTDEHAISVPKRAQIKLTSLHTQVSIWQNKNSRKK